ncbi:MAG: hypothetical protein JST00_15420 [Deltaproteobacteria bacterium]|nr:hypothetical protein [Deltaproteobacteria bacterium]
MPTHTTLSGHIVEYERTPPIDAFLRRLEAMVDDDTASPDDFIELAYSKSNPILDCARPGTRGWVTREVISHPVYAIVGDLLFRKQLARDGTPVARIAAKYSMTIADVAYELGITTAEVEDAIAQHRVGAWIKDGQPFLQPHGLTFLRQRVR